MNYCTGCGKKLSKTDKFCTKCGTKVITKEELKQKEDKKNQNIILLLGIFLVLFASFALGIVSWKDMSDILRIGFFAFECLLFFGLSFVLKNLTNNNIYRLFFVVGLLLIPYTLSLIPYYGLLTDYFNKGPGIYVYLAIIYFITFIIYMLINIRFKSKFMNFISLFVLLLTFIFIALFFDTSPIIMSLVLNVYLLVIIILSNTNLFNDNMKFASNIFIGTLIIINMFMTLGAISYESYEMNLVLSIISSIIYFVCGYLCIFNNKGTFYEVVLPFAYSFITTAALFTVLNKYQSVAVYGTVVICTILYFVSLLSNKKIFNIISLIVTYLTFVSMLLYSIIDLTVVFIVISGLLFLFNLFNILVSKNKFAEYLLPFNIFIIFYGISRLTIDFKMVYVLLSTSIVFLIIYVILKIKKSKLDLAYLITAYSLTMISMYNFAYGFNIINFGIIFMFLMIFLLSYIFKENIAISIISFVSLNLSSLLIFEGVDYPIYYGLLTISGLTLIISLLIYHIKGIKLKPYILYSEIVIFIITLTNNMKFPSYILFINIFIYALSYLAIINFHNYKWWRLSYIMLGLLTIIRVINNLIDPIVIASLISIVVILIILTIMYLLDLEKNVSLALLSLILLYPYYRLVGNVLSEVHELYFIPLIIYTVVFTEIINFKDEENRKISTIIPLSVISFFFFLNSNGVASIVVDVILSLGFILLGLYRKYNYLIYFGVIFIVITLLLKIFTILNSIAVVILLIIIGFALIGAALFNEFKKKK